MLYNTGMRAQELVDLDVRHVRLSRPSNVLIFGKGRKERVCPLWPETVSSVKSYLQTRAVRFTDAVPLFLNTDGNRLTRYGVRYIVSRRITQAAQRCPILLTRRVTPHTWRHMIARGKYLKALAIACIERSMSRTGNCFDNATMESFWSTYKTESGVEEVLPPTRRAAELATFDYIETFYNPTRRHSSLGYLSPVAFENHQLNKDIKAA